MQLCRPSMNKFAWFERWRLLLENAPLECDGMTRCISTLLHHHQIEHSVHIGALIVEDVGRIPLHWWIVLEGGEHIDLRAQMWLGKHPHVPHGIFLPTHVATYETLALEPGGQCLDAFLFALLCGREISDFSCDLIPPKQSINYAARGLPALAGSGIAASPL